MVYKLDKSHFKKQNLKEADHNEKYWKTRSVTERLSAAWYLICQAYNIPYDNPPGMDKTYFRKRSRKL